MNEHEVIQINNLYLVVTSRVLDILKEIRTFDLDPHQKFQIAKRCLHIIVSKFVSYFDECRGIGNE